MFFLRAHLYPGASGRAIGCTHLPVPNGTFWRGTCLYPCPIATLVVLNKYGRQIYPKKYSKKKFWQCMRFRYIWNELAINKKTVFRHQKLSVHKNERA